MKFLMTVIADDTGVDVPESLYEEMGQYIESKFADGSLIDTGGLAPAGAAKTVTLAGGEIGVKDGPFSEAKEVVGGYALMSYDSEEDAIAGAKEFLDLHRRHIPDYVVHSEIRQVFGPDDAEPQES